MEKPIFLANNSVFFVFNPFVSVGYIL